MHFSKYLQKKKNISDYYKEQLKKKTVRKKSCMNKEREMLDSLHLLTTLIKQNES